MVEVFQVFLEEIHNAGIPGAEMSQRKTNGT